METRDVVFVLVPQFSMIALYSALEPMRVANRFRPESFSWRFVSVDGRPVSASNGIPVSVSGDLGAAGNPDIAFLCASYDHDRMVTRSFLKFIRLFSTRTKLFAGLDCAPLIMAEAGVLDGYRATCHWEVLSSMRENYPRIDVYDDLFVIDRARATCSGGTVALDMMLAWLASEYGWELSDRVADTLVHSRKISAPGGGRIPVGLRYQTDDERLISAINAMEEHLEDVLSIADVAAVAGLSQRQLERLFLRQLGYSPKSLYLRLRLEQAERLLTYSRLPVSEVALASGFNGLSQFTRAYKNRFGCPPTWHRRGKQHS